SSAQAADLTVNGVPASAVTAIDADTLEFTISGANTGDGVYTVSLAAGALTSLSGAASAAFTATFDADVTNPRVVASSVAEGDTLQPGGLVYTARFSEGLATAGLGGEDVTLVNAATGQSFTAAAFAYDAATNTVTVTFNNLP